MQKGNYVMSYKFLNTKLGGISRATSKFLKDCPQFNDEKSIT